MSHLKIVSDSRTMSVQQAKEFYVRGKITFEHLNMVLSEFASQPFIETLEEKDIVLVPDTDSRDSLISKDEISEYLRELTEQDDYTERTERDFNRKIEDVKNNRDPRDGI